MSAQEPFSKRFHLHVDAPFGAQDERFHLTMPQLLELEQTFDAGVIVIFRRLSEGTCRANEIRETLRLGLVGGGKTPAEALALVRNNHDGFPLDTNLGLAASIVSAVLFGRPKEEEPDNQQVNAARGDQMETL